MIIEAYLTKVVSQTLTATVTVEVPDDFPTWSAEEKDAALHDLYVEADGTLDFESDPGEEDEFVEGGHVAAEGAERAMGQYPHYRLASKGAYPEYIDPYEVKFDALTTELETYCKAQGLTPEDADELVLREDITDEQRVWLVDFIQRWERVEEDNR